MTRDAWASFAIAGASTDRDGYDDVVEGVKWCYSMLACRDKTEVKSLSRLSCADKDPATSLLLIAKVLAIRFPALVWRIGPSAGSSIASSSSSSAGPSQRCKLPDAGPTISSFPHLSSQLQLLLLLFSP